jgi:hypothetical protein
MTHAKVLRVASGVFFLALGVSSLLFSQAGAGSIVGSTHDPTGAVIPGALITAHQLDTGVETTTTTTGAGNFTFPVLPVGHYNVTAAFKGFATVTKENVQVILGRSLTVDFDLPVAAAAQATTVTASAPILDTTTTSTGTTATLNQIADLPLAVNGSQRNPQQFLGMFAGVSVMQGYVPGSIVNGSGDAGGFRSVTSYRVDGLWSGVHASTGMVDYVGPVPDLLQEFRLVTNTNADTGWDNGATIEVVKKSGTNTLHGTLYEFVRNTVFDARYFAAPDRGTEKQNEFGAIMGGPIRKDKDFFMASFLGFSYRALSPTAVATVPTAKMQLGDFSELLGAQVGTDSLGRPVYQGEVYDPQTTRPDGKGGIIRDPFSFNGQLNVMDPARLSPISTYFQKYYPLPTSPGLTNNWMGAYLPSPVDERGITIKTDHYRGAHRISAEWEWTPVNGNIGCSGLSYGSVPQFAPEITECHHYNFNVNHWRLNYNWTPKPNILLNLSLGTNVSFGGYDPAPATLGQGTKAGLKGTITDGTPYVGVQGYTGYGVYLYSLGQTIGTFPGNLDVTWVRGSHEAKFGAQYLNLYNTSVYPAYTNGGFNFADVETGLPGFSQTGWGWSSYLLGTVDSSLLQSSLAYRPWSAVWSFYGQDKWRVTSKLTVNYGLRWDIYQTPHETYDRFSFFSPNVPNPAAGGHPGALNFWGEGPGRNGRHALQDTFWKAFGPRLGIAYQANPKTVVHAFYGIYRYPTFSILFGGAQQTAYGWGVSFSPTSLDNGVTPAFNWNSGFPIAVPKLPILDPTLQNGSAVFDLDPTDNKVGAEQNLGLGIERELPGKLLFKIDYVGHLAHNLPSTNEYLNDINLNYLSYGNLLLADINSPQARAAGIPIPYTGFQGSVAQALRPYPQYSYIAKTEAPQGNALYHSVQLNLEKRFQTGLSFLVNYTISKHLTNDQTDGPFGPGPNSYIQADVMRGHYKALQAGLDVP